MARWGIFALGYFTRHRPNPRARRRPWRGETAGLLERFAEAQGRQIRHMQITLPRLNDMAQSIGPQIAKFRSIRRATTAQRVQNNHKSSSHVFQPLLA